MKRRGNGCFHVVSTWNPRDVFVGKLLTSQLKAWVKRGKNVIIFLFIMFPDKPNIKKNKKQSSEGV